MQGPVQVHACPPGSTAQLQLFRGHQFLDDPITVGQQLLRLPGLLEESSLPWPWGPSHHLPLQTDVGQGWIIFNAVLFPLDSSRALSPLPVSFLPPSPSDSLGN